MKLKAAGRLVAALSWVALGLAICLVVFPFWRYERRMRCVSWWSRRLLAKVGVDLQVRGKVAGSDFGALAPSDVRRPSRASLVVANHVSWLDILAVNAVAPARFVSKAEVRRWPLVGWLASSGGTLFIERGNRRDARRVVLSIADALAEGQSVAVFPEGTVGDGHALLPFHGNLLQSAVTAKVSIQPMAIRYVDRAHPTEPSPVVAYDGDVTIVQSITKVLAADGLTATIECLPRIRPELDRRALAVHVRAAIAEALGSPEHA